MPRLFSRTFVTALLLVAVGCTAAQPASSPTSAPTAAKSAPAATAAPPAPPAPAKPTTAPQGAPTAAPQAAAKPTDAPAAAKPTTAAGADLTAAKAEGSVSWYTSTPQNLADEIAKRFEQQTGIKVQVFRSGGEAVMQRFLAEQDAGKTAADVLTTSDQAAFASLSRDGKLLAYKPVGWEFVPDNSKDKDGAWFAQRLNLIVPLYRTDKVSDPPKGWQDLASPRFKGQVITADPAFTSIAFLIVHKLSGLLGWDYYTQLAANDTMIVQGHAQVAQGLLSGERSVALEADISALFAEMQKGAPIKLISPEEGSFLITSPQGIPAKAAHPNAAKAFMDFNLNPEVQNLFAHEGIHSVRTDVAAPTGLPELKSLKVLDIDYAAAEKDNKQVKDHFAEIFH